MDSLEVMGLSVAARIGVHPWEQRISQRLLIDITIPSTFENVTDNLSETLDYSQLCQCVTEHLESKTFQLIETVANELALLIKNQFKINQITVAVSKPRAIPAAANIKVQVTR